MPNNPTAGFSVMCKDPVGFTTRSLLELSLEELERLPSDLIGPPAYFAVDLDRGIIVIWPRKSLGGPQV